MNKTGVEITTTFVNASETLGTVDGILTAASSKILQDDIARMFYAYMATGFDTYYRGMAFANPQRYGHMYDWDLMGRPSGRLWKHQLKGRAGNREATWAFLPSTKPVPEWTPQNTYIESGDFPTLKRNGQHMFPAKAMVFESGQKTTITPRGKAMFIPLYWKNQKGRKIKTNFGSGIELTDRDKKRGFVWLQRSTTQDHQESMGAFGMSFLGYFQSNADRVFSEKVEPRINNRIRKVYTSRVRDLGGSAYVSKGAQNRRRSFSVKAVSDSSRIAQADMRKEFNAAVREAMMDWDDDYDIE